MRLNLLNIKRNSFLKIFLPILVISLFLLCNAYSEEVTENISNKLIRLHVVANSNSKEDQALKLKVRNKILIYMNEKLKESKSLSQSKNIIIENMGEIQNIAQNEVIKNNKSYGVSVKLDRYSFPTKKYGDITLPAGEYQALKVMLGEAVGANWWCVLFPPLCFVDATHGNIPEYVKDDLKNVLSDEEYQLVDSSEREIPVKVKFKVVEFFQSSKVKIKGVISKIAF